MTKEALTLLVHEMEYVLSCINENKIPFDGDDFHEALRLGKEALAQPEQRSANEHLEPVAWKPDRSGKYLTVVYRDVIPGDEVGAIVDHPKCVIMSWSNAVHDVEQLKNTTPPQPKPLTDEEILEILCIYLDEDDDIEEWRHEINEARAIEAAHGIKEKNT